LQELRDNRENVRYLPGIKFSEKLQPVDTVAEAIDDARMVLFSAPAQHFRSALDHALPYISQDMIIVNVAKGIEQKTLKRMSEIAHDKMANMKYVTLSLQNTFRIYL